MAKPKRQSRADRWNSATDKARSALDTINDILQMPEDDRDAGMIEGVNQELSNLSEAFTDLYDLQQEYQDWYDNMPEALQANSPTADKLQAIIDLSLEPDIPSEWDEDLDLSDAESCLDEAEGADLPLGFGRD